MIKYKIGNVTTEVKVKQYKDGCVEVDINIGSKPVDLNPHNITVAVQFGEGGLSINDRLMALDQTVDALQRYYPMSTICLYMPYLPYARQDRITKEGGGFGLKRLGTFLNNMNVQAVTSFDPHSYVSSGVIDRFYSHAQFDVFRNVKRSWANTYIVAPDMGAQKKCEDFAKLVGAAGVIRCTKVRNPDTMELTDLKVIDWIDDGSELFILDDLIDGGRTFVNIANHLKSEYNIGKLELAATHGLFTYGVETVAKHFDNLYTTNSYDSDKNAVNVKVIDVFNIA